jgi:hypothetical protein
VKPRKFRFAAMLAIFLAFALPSVQAIQASARPVPTPGPAVRQSAENTAGITGGTLFGGTYPLVAEQGKLGRKLSIVRIYYMVGQKFTTPHIKQLMSAGTTVLASLDVPIGHGITYASIAAGRQDKQILAWLTQAEQNAVTYHVPAVYVAFEHEANNPPNHVNGTPAQFIKAWDHIHALAAKAHLNVGSGGRLRWALILMHMAYFTVSERPKWSLRIGFAKDYWPGAANVDVVAADGYNRGGCRSHRTAMPTQASVTPGSLFNPVLDFARLHGNKPVFLAEWASAAFSALPAWQAHYIGEMKAYVLANPRLAAVLYWDNHGYFGCSFAVDGHPLSVAALKNMGQSLHGHI